MTGKIVKGIAGFYYVYTKEEGLIACKARGIFRKLNKKPLVGDDVDIVITDPVDREGNIEEIFERRNELPRPACANIDRALITFACEKPSPNFVLLDKMILSIKDKGIKPGICFNKSDLIDDATLKEYMDIYRGEDALILTVSIENDEGMDKVRKFLEGKTTVILGPSGVGKSSMTNYLSKEDVMEVGEISKKLMRGKNTTRHAELFPIGNNSFIMDTPGFTALETPDIKSEDLKYYYNEFEDYNGNCHFNGCVHVNEPDCAVKDAVRDGEINITRYNNYKAIYEELREEEKRRYK